MINISFQKGFGPDIKMAEKIVRSIGRQNYQSTTKYNLKINQLDPEKRDISPYSHLIAVRNTLIREISMMKNICREVVYPSYDVFVRFIRMQAKKIGVANCLEQALFAQAELTKMGKKADILTLEILKSDKKALLQQARSIDKRVNAAPLAISKSDCQPRNVDPNSFDVSDHVFLLINHDKNADFTNPKTWGKNAIIVDPWLGIVKSANEALAIMKRTFKFNKKEEEIFFQKRNEEDIFIKDPIAKSLRNS